MCTHPTCDNEKYRSDFPSFTAQSLCPVYGVELCPSSKAPPTVLERLYGDTPLLSRVMTAARHLSQTSIAAPLRTAQTSLPSLSIYSITSSGVKAYHTLSATRSLLSDCSSPTNMTGFYSARLASACSSSFPRNAEYMICRKFPDNF